MRLCYCFDTGTEKGDPALGKGNWCQRSACAALGRWRQNVAATINGVFGPSEVCGPAEAIYVETVNGVFFSLFLLRLLSPRRGSPRVLKFSMQF